MITRETIINKAEIWVESMWHDAYTRWSERSGQDKSYRWRVIHPVIVNFIKNSYQDRHPHILDLGCGDGVFLDDQTTRELISGDGVYLGIDVSSKLLERARIIHKYVTNRKITY